MLPSSDPSLSARGAETKKMILGGMNGPQGGAGSASIPEISERDFEAEVLRSELPVLVEFSAEWCAPCKQVAPILAAIAAELAGKAKIVKLDIDKSPNLPRQLRIQSVPSFLLIVGGKIADMQVGALDKASLMAMLEPHLPRAAGALKAIELAAALQQGAAVPVDTRDAGAFARAHLPAAVNIPLEEIQNRLAELHMLAGEPVLYCRSGDKAKELAESLAVDDVNVAFLEGGILAWESEGLPIDRD